MEPATVFPSLTYDDASAAVAFLVDAFGAEKHAFYAGDDGTVHHAELRFGNGLVMLGNSRPDYPATRGGGGGIYVFIEDVDAHHARARQAGVEITQELRDTEYGSREYGAVDTEGNRWWFGTYQPFAYDHSVEEAVHA